MIHALMALSEFPQMPRSRQERHRLFGNASIALPIREECFDADRIALRVCHREVLAHKTYDVQVLATATGAMRRIKLACRQTDRHAAFLLVCARRDTALRAASAARPTCTDSVDIVMAMLGTMVCQQELRCCVVQFAPDHFHKLVTHDGLARLLVLST